MTANAMALAIDALLAAGFLPDGHTRQELVRIPTRNSPVFGHSGGELAKLGGRQRFALPDTDVKCTVGKRTLALYRTGVSGLTGLTGVTGLATLNTSDLSGLAVALAALQPHHPA